MGNNCGTTTSKSYYTGIDMYKNLMKGSFFKKFFLKLASTLITTFLVVKSHIPLYAKLDSESIMSLYDIINKLSSYSEYVPTSRTNCDLKSNNLECPERNLDWGYLKKLDLVIGAVALSTGIVRNLRFNNGYIEKVFVERLGSSEGRIWNKDSGDGFANVMTFLFPSSLGELCSESPSNDCFSGAVNPTPETVAQLIGIIYSIREKFSTEERNSRVEHFKSCIRKRIVVQNNTMVSKNTIKKSIQKINAFLKNIEIVISNQESDLENPELNSENPLPKYTIERMILAYFIEHFNSSEDVERFYRELEKQLCCKRELRKPASDNKESIIEEIGDLHKAYKKTMKSLLIPYTSVLFPHGICGSIIKMKDGNIKFGNSVFSDCVETSIRHVINILTYDIKNKRFSLHRGIDENPFILKILSAIKNKDELKYDDLRVRLQAFYFYQTPEKINDAHPSTVTLWNYVISNINDAGNGLYCLRYFREDQNELKSGLINSLKAYYNIAYSIRYGLKCEGAKNAIDCLMINFNQNQSIHILSNNLRNAFEKTLGLINTRYIVKAELVGHINKERCFKLSESDLFGCIKINLFDKSNNKILEFKINHKNGHGQTVYTCKSRIKLQENDINLCLKNKDISILYNFFNNSIKLDDTVKKIDVIYSTFNVNNIYNKEINEFYKRGLALNFYKTEIDPHTYIKDIFQFLKDYKVNLESASNIKIYEKTNNKTNIKDLCDFIIEGINRNELEFVCLYVLNNMFSSCSAQRYEDTKICSLFKQQLERLMSIFDNLISQSISINYLRSIVPEHLFYMVNEKTLMSQIIKKSTYNDFCRVIERLDPNVINYNDVNSSINQDQQLSYMNTFEYCVSLHEWEKAKKVVENLCQVESHNFILSEQGSSYTALGIILKENMVSIIKNHLKKFKLHKPVYINNNIKYSSYGYALNILRNPCLEYQINPNKKLKTDLLNKINVNLESLSKLSRGEMFELYDNKSVFAIAIEVLNPQDLKTLFRRINVSNYDFVFDLLDQGLNAFEYAVKINRWEILQDILDCMSHINSYRFILSACGKKYTAIGVLIKNGKGKILKDNLNKIRLKEIIYKDNLERTYSLKDYLSNPEKLI